MYDVLVAGEINPDLVLAGNIQPEFGQIEKLVDEARLTIGSSSAIFACGAARLGLKVDFVGVCGDDVFGHFMLDEMQKRGVNTSNVVVRVGGSTGLSVILNRGSDRAILTFSGLIAALTAADIPDALLRQSRHLHVASYFLQKGLQPGLPELFQRAHAAGSTTSLDPNYDPSEQWEGIDALLQVTDAFLPNETEALSISHAAEAETAAKQLSRKAALAAIKLGGAGALACEDDCIVRAASVSIDVIDSIGAGDSFDAGFIFGFLQHWKLEKTLRLACACGALSMRRAGGTDGQPTLDEALHYVPG